MVEPSEMGGGTVTHIAEGWLDESLPRSIPDVHNSPPEEKPLVKPVDSDTESTIGVIASSLEDDANNNDEDKDCSCPCLLEDSEDLNALLSVDFEEEEDEDDAKEGKEEKEEDDDHDDHGETSHLSLNKKTKRRRINYDKEEEEEDEVNSKPVAKVKSPLVKSYSVEDEYEETGFVSRREEIKHRVNLLKGILPARASLNCKDADVVLDETIRYMRALQDMVLKLEARKRARPANTGSLCKRTG